MNIRNIKISRVAPLITPADLSADSRRDVGTALNLLLADTFARL